MTHKEKTAYLRRASRRVPAFRRKWAAAWQGLEFLFDNTEHEFSYNGPGMILNVHTYFTHNGQRLRTDYSMSTDGPLPRVHNLREIVWSMLKDYQISQSLQKQ